MYLVPLANTLWVYVHWDMYFSGMYIIVHDPECTAVFINSCSHLAAISPSSLQHIFTIFYSLRGNQIGDVGACEVAACLKSSNTLQKLS